MYAVYDIFNCDTYRYNVTNNELMIWVPYTQNHSKANELCRNNEKLRGIRIVGTDKIYHCNGAVANEYDRAYGDQSNLVITFKCDDIETFSR